MISTGLRTSLRPLPMSLRTLPIRSQRQGVRMYSEADKGGLDRSRSKLIFRFGVKDIPVELYPMAFVVAAACVGATFAIGRHIYLDGLRLGPGQKNDKPATA